MLAVLSLLVDTTLAGGGFGGATFQQPAAELQSSGTIDVTALGADATGHRDSTAPIQRAFDIAANLASTAYATGGRPALEVGAPLLLFPSGQYIISDVINISRYGDHTAPRWPASAARLRVQGEGTAVILQTKDSCGLLFCDQAWRVTVKGLQLSGGVDQLALGNNNTGNAAVIRVAECEFEHATGAAIRHLGPSCEAPECPTPAFVGSFSTQLIVRDCVFDFCDQALISWSDWGVLADSWIVTSPTMIDKAVVENHGRLKVQNILGNPEALVRSCPSNASRARWFDNYSHRVDGGMLTISNFRFGGEARGITAIVNHAPYFCQEIESALETQLCGRVNRSLPASQPSFRAGMRGAEGSSIIVESSEFGGGCGNSTDPTACCAKINGAEIVLEEVPSQLVISNCWAQSLFDPVSLIHVDSAIELDGPYIRAADTVPGSRPSFMINLNDARPFSSLPPASLSAKFGLPDQLRAFLTGLSRIGGTGPPTAGSWRRGTVVMSDIETGPIGWLCISSGYPGEWANLSVPLLGLTG